ncbi:hypothetical protein [Pontibacter sp. G13]|uniref:hypothetical protein n=1 Tax=Pontibacter sp. G13 TaxID=3074898 RepID=UPI00288AAC91|nr:hypothetical protein [Pontibacter sp. G13]WNJ17224.1 hypothetical protein RJD25_20400 [Pontibacter sp. G13]
MSSDLFERKLQSKLYRAEMAPPPAIWEGLNREMTARRSKIAGWWSGVDLMILLIGLMIWGAVDPANQLDEGSASAPLMAEICDTAYQGFTPHTQMVQEQASAQFPSPPAPNHDAQSATPSVSPQSFTALATPDTLNAQHTDHSIIPSPLEGNRLQVDVFRPEAPTIDLAFQPDAQDFLIESLESQALARMPAKWKWTATATMMTGLCMSHNWSLGHAGVCHEGHGQSLAGDIQSEDIYLFALPSYQWSVGVRAIRYIDERIRLESGLGIQVSQAGTWQLGQFTEFGSDMIGIPAQSLYREVHYGDQHSFREVKLEIPLFATYELGGSTHKLLLSAGGALRYQGRELNGLSHLPDQVTIPNVSPRGETFQPSAPTKEIPGEDLLSIRSIYAQVGGKIQYQRRLPGNRALNFGPRYGYLLTPAYRGLVVAGQSRHLIGLEVALEWW